MLKPVSKQAEESQRKAKELFDKNRQRELDLIKERGGRRIRLVSLVSAPEGIACVHKHYKTLPIFTASIDRELNEVGYILPGLGDAGDRLFGT